MYTNLKLFPEEEKDDATAGGGGSGPGGGKGWDVGTRLKPNPHPAWQLSWLAGWLKNRGDAIWCTARASGPGGLAVNKYYFIHYVL